MEKNIVVFVRHGTKLYKNGKQPTSYDADSGPVLDPPIVPGKIEIARVKRLHDELICDNEFEIFSSPFERAIETSKIIIENPSRGEEKNKYIINVIPEIGEYLGNQNEKFLIDEYGSKNLFSEIAQSVYTSGMLIWETSYKELVNRCKQFAKTLMTSTKYKSFKGIRIYVTHGVVISEIVREIFVRYANQVELAVKKDYEAEIETLTRSIDLPPMDWIAFKVLPIETKREKHDIY